MLREVGKGRLSRPRVKLNIIINDNNNTSNNDENGIFSLFLLFSVRINEWVRVYVCGFM